MGAVIYLHQILFVLDFAYTIWDGDIVQASAGLARIQDGPAYRGWMAVQGE